LQAVVVRQSWTPLPIFELIQRSGNVPQSEMDRTFNLGIGMIVVVDYDETDALVTALNEAGHPAAEIGKLQPGPPDVLII
ncbi:MAG: AIR synthase-related protein, partial [bacterium]